ncbi:MAG: DUF1643 domain-containing protein [Bacteroides sp.]|nr:DUF1643 domain-containing protein [Bacteroides sp.]
MTYESITMQGDADTVRYLLEKRGERMLYVFGINPSTANENKADPTMRKVMGFAERNGFDGFVMMNLYPQRSTNPNGLHKERNEQLHQQNLITIAKTFTGTEAPVVLLAFGNNIAIRRYLKDCLRDIYRVLLPHHPNWCQIGIPTQEGHPRHPLYAKYQPLSAFEVENYLQ